MAQTKKDVQQELDALGVEYNAKSTVAELRELLVANQVSDEVVEDIAVAEGINEAIDEVPAEQAAVEAVAEDTTEEVATAKAGRRSAKALREAAEEEARQERIASGESEEAKPHQAVKPTRPRLARRAKQYRKNAEQIEKDKTYSLEESIALAQKTSHVKFDATVELHINLGVDPRQADQNIRDNLVLPAGTGKSIRIAVLTEDAAAAKQVGADIAGTDELLGEIEKGNLNFDILISTPQLMARLGKYARTLGPRGLMPNPKSGTVTPDVAKAVAEAKAGRVEYRVDSTGIIHLGVGKVSFQTAQLQQNIQAVMASITTNKPASLKGNYIKAAHLSTSMGPSITIDIANL